MHARFFISIAIAVAYVLIAQPATAKEYGTYDLKKIVTATESQAGKQYGVDGKFLDQVLADLTIHAQDYPAKFDSFADRQRAVKDVGVLGLLMEGLIDAPNVHPEVLIRAAHLHAMAHNLEIAGAAEKAASMYQKLMVMQGSDPRTNFLFGKFLSSAGKPEQGLPFLTKALAGGVTEAAYSMGLSYMAVGDKARALEFLELYRQKSPDSAKVARVIEAVKSGKLEVKRTGG